MQANSAEQLVADGVVDVREACAFTGLSRTTLYGEMDAGRLPYVKIGKSRRIPRRGLVEMLARGLVGGGRG